MQQETIDMASRLKKISSSPAIRRISSLRLPNKGESLQSMLDAGMNSMLEDKQIFENAIAIEKDFSMDRT